MNFQITALVAILVLYGVFFAVGALANRKQQKSFDELLLASRGLSLPLGIFTMVATWVGGGFLNGTAEAVFDPQLRVAQRACVLEQLLVVVVPEQGEVVDAVADVLDLRRGLGPGVDRLGEGGLDAPALEVDLDGGQVVGVEVDLDPSLPQEGLAEELAVEDAHAAVLLVDGAALPDEEELGCDLGVERLGLTSLRR